MKNIFTVVIIILSAFTGSIAQTIGTKEAGFANGNNPQLDKPIRMSPYKDGAILFVDFNNNAIRTANIDGEVTTLVGGPEMKGYRDGTADQALFAGIHGVAYDQQNDIIYIASATNNVIRKISNIKGELFVETIAGNQADKGFANGEAKSALFNSLHQILLGENGEIFVLDIGNAKVRMLKDGMVSTIAGTDSVSPLRVEWKYPIDMAFDNKDIVICDAGNSNIYRLILNSKVEKLILDTKLEMPHGIASNNNSTLYIADMGSNKILKIESDKHVTVIEENDLNKPAAVLVDDDVLWIADLYNHQIKIINISK